jgi:cell division protein FtsX
MPDVQAFAFISRKLALQQLRKELKKNGSSIASSLTSTLPLPTSFEIVLKPGGNARAVAQRFTNSPLVDNDPGSHDGVAFEQFPAKP